MSAFTTIYSSWSFWETFGSKTDFQLNILVDEKHRLSYSQYKYVQNTGKAPSSLLKMQIAEVILWFDSIHQEAIVSKKHEVQKLTKRLSEYCILLVTFRKFAIVFVICKERLRKVIIASMLYLIGKYSVTPFISLTSKSVKQTHSNSYGLISPLIFVEPFVYLRCSFDFIGKNARGKAGQIFKLEL